MWEEIKEIINGPNGIIICILLIIIIFLIVRYAKLGLINIKTKNLSVGKTASETERTIMRNQIEWAKLACQAFESKIPRFEGYDIYKGKYIIERVFDECVKWIAFNHIETTDAYISIKQEIIWNMVQSYVENEKLRSKSFKKTVDEYVAYVVTSLVNIREEYDKN